MASAEVIRGPEATRSLCASVRESGQRIALVPTMGALHAGHLELIRYADAHADFVAVSIFINPTQFAPGEDFESYPRQEADDVQAASAAGAKLVFAPRPRDIYPEHHLTTVRVDRLSDGLCGTRRPGHFQGVATIVTKLFNITRPHLAIFGEKDFQQLAVIKRLSADLNMGIEVVGVPTVRAPDGLALSSRNQYLSPEQRENALSLIRGLRRAEAAFIDGERSATALLATARNSIDSNDGVALEYLELRDATTLEPISGEVLRTVVLAVAAHVGATRLIDNIVLGRND